MTQESKPLITINIDGRDVEVPAGINAIEAAKIASNEIPHYCYHSKLSVVGNCRMCLIELGMPMRDRATGEPVLDESGIQKIGWSPRPVIGCATNVSPGMHIRTDSKLVKDCQNGVTEFLLLNHPLDCPICDQAGECRLQEFSADYGKGKSRFIENKVVKPKRTRLGPRVTLDDERCILCSRCIRFCKEIVDDDVLGFTERGSYTTLTCHPGKELKNNYSLNTVDICPVGALTSTDFRFKMRTWFLKRTNSICAESSVGVNTVVYSREGKIYRITPRQNDYVNDTWMSDSGRSLYKEVEAENRLKEYKVDGHRVSADEACIRVSELLPTGSTAYIASGYMTVEEHYLLKQLAKKSPGNVDIISHYEEGDELLISNDRRPNMRGTLVTGLTNNIPTNDLSHIAQLIEEKSINNLVVFNEDVSQLGLTQAQLKKVNLIYFGTHQNESSDVAKVLLPILTVFEKAGTFVNQQFRLQKFDKAIPGPEGVMDEIHALSYILALLNKADYQRPNVSSIWKTMNAEVSKPQGITFEKLSDEGCLLDATEFKSIEFPEGKTLHYEPSKVLAQ